MKGRAHFCYVPDQPVPSLTPLIEGMRPLDFVGIERRGLADLSASILALLHRAD
jgi:hypothetical protein